MSWVMSRKWLLIPLVVAGLLSILRLLKSFWTIRGSSPALPLDPCERIEESHALELLEGVAERTAEQKKARDLKLALALRDIEAKYGKRK
jgi:hypothetical protein